MGFTALDGLPMGTRPGQLDPGVVLHLIEEKGMTAPEVTRLLYNGAGLKGLSGISNDMRDLLASDDPAAAFAIDHFVHRCGALTPASSPPPSAGSTRSSSPPASASTRPRFAPAWPSACAGSAPRSTRPPTRPAPPAFPLPTAASRFSSSRRTRS